MTTSLDAENNIEQKSTLSHDLKNNLGDTGNWSLTCCRILIQNLSIILSGEISETISLK